LVFELVIQILRNSATFVDFVGFVDFVDFVAVVVVDIVEIASLAANTFVVGDTVAVD
jgi:hypothetical protein